MSYELLAPTVLGRIDPHVFEYFKAEHQKRDHCFFTLYGVEVKECPVLPLIQPFIDQLPVNEAGKPAQIFSIKSWRHFVLPGKTFAGDSVRFVHRDTELEILATSQQGTEFVSGIVEDEVLATRLQEASVETMRGLSDAEMLLAGLSIQQMLPNVVAINTPQTWHRTSINNKPERQERFMFAANAYY